MTEHEFEMEMMNHFGVTLEEQLAACGITIDEFFEDMEREFAESKREPEDSEEDFENWDSNFWDLEIGYDPDEGCYSDEC